MHSLFFHLPQLIIFDLIGENEGQEPLQIVHRWQRGNLLIVVIPSFTISDERYSFMASLLGDDFSPEFFECLDRVPKVEYIKDILQSLMPQLQNVDATEVAEHMRRYLPENERLGRLSFSNLSKVTLLKVMKVVQ